MDEEKGCWFQSIQRHNGTLGTFVAQRLPPLSKLSHPIERDLTTPSLIPLHSPIHPFTLHLLTPTPHPPIPPLCTSWILLHAHPRPNCTYLTPLYNQHPFPPTFYTLYTSTQMLCTFVYTVCLSLSPLYAIHIYVAFTIFYQHCSHRTTLLLIIIAHSSSADRITRL